MTEVTPKLVAAMVAAGGSVTMIFGLVLLRLTLTRRLKKKLKEGGGYWGSGIIDAGLTSTALFAWACTLPYVQRSERFRMLFGDLNVRSFASRFEIAVAYGIIGGVLAFLLFGALFYVFDK